MGLSQGFSAIGRWIDCDIRSQVEEKVTYRLVAAGLVGASGRCSSGSFA